MRLALLSALVLAVALPAAEAQMPSPFLVVRFGTTPEPVDPGNATAVSFLLERHCVSAAQVLDPQQMEVAIAGDGNWSIVAPSSVMFAQQVCATQPSQTVQVAVELQARPEAPHATASDFFASFRGLSASPLTPAIPEQFVPFTASTAAAPAVAEAMPEPVRESPAPPAALLLGALALLVAVVRRAS